MADDTLEGEISYWASEVRNWECECAGRYHAVQCPPMVLCQRCAALASLEAALDHLQRGDTEACLRSVERAAEGVTHFDALRDRLEHVVFADTEVVDMDDTGKAAAPRFDPPCGLTIAEHDEIKMDAIRREAELVKAGQVHDDELGIHLQLAHHPPCGSTLAWPLAYHRDEHVR